ncbi:hypothetical protein BT69DRAFT_1284201 [Atractiella rhizophila]|nr:hypothetical protein BT69DRAFT_1284201 [Atractiella rhizophila]
MVIAVNHQQFSVELSCQNSALATGDADFRRVAVDVYYDLDAADQDKMAMERKAKRKSNKLRRVVQHPNFHNFNAGQAEQHLAGRPRGDCVIRPSSRGMDHLALTWKVDEGVYQHLDILELDKPNEASLGRTLRVGGKYSYSDLDELIFSHVKAMARKVEEMMNSEKYKGSEQELNTFLTNYVMANPDKSIYAFGIDKRNPGQFLCSFKANSSSPIQSWSVKLVPGAFVLQDKFSDPLPDMVMLCNAFKTRYTVMGQQARAAPARTQPTPYHQSSRTPNPYAAQTPMHPSRTPNPYAAPSAGSHTPHYGAPTPRVPPVGTVYATTPHYGAPTPVWPPPGSQTPNFPYQQPGPQHAGWGGTTPGGPGGGALQQQSYGYR